MEIEKSVPAHLLQIGESFLQKYQPVLDFDGWRVAMLRHSEATDCNHFNRVERHNETHEVFILTEGEAELIVAESGDIPGEVFIFPMRRNVAYNVLPGVWHHAVLSEESHIILFEKTNTSKNNSDYYSFDEAMINKLKKRFRAGEQ